MLPQRNKDLSLTVFRVLFLILCQFIHTTTPWGKVEMTGLDVAWRLKRSPELPAFQAWERGWMVVSFTEKETPNWGRRGELGFEHTVSKVTIQYPSTREMYKKQLEMWTSDFCKIKSLKPYERNGSEQPEQPHFAASFLGPSRNTLSCSHVWPNSPS